MKNILQITLGLLLSTSLCQAQTQPSMENLILGALQANLLGQPNGAASLNSSGQIPNAQIPLATTTLNGGVPSGGSSGRAWNPVDGWFVPAGGSGGGSGTVTVTSLTPANGFSGTVTNPTTAPNITLSTTISGILKGNGIAMSAAVPGTDYVIPTGSGAGLTGIAVSQVSGAAPLASPALTGTPTAPTATAGTNTTQLATTAFVQASSAAATPVATTSQLYGGSGTAGYVAVINLGTNLSMSGNTLNATGGSGGSGTVTSASVVTANGFSGTVANPTTTPAITINTSITGMIKGNGSALSAALAGTDYLAPNGNGSALTGLTNSQISGSQATLPSAPATQVYAGSGTAGVTSSLTQTQLTALINPATAGLSGAIPSGGSTGKAWNPADGWFTPSGSGNGTVTSVGLTAPSFMTVGNSPITTNGTLSLTINTQSANTVLAAPNGTAGVPSFRGLVVADVAGVQSLIPSATTSQLYGGSGTAGTLVPITLGTNLSMSGTTLNAAGGGGGGVTSITAGTGLSGGTITTSGTLALVFGTTAGTAVQGNDSRLSTFTTSTPGIVPSSGGGTTNFMRADGTWAAPAVGSVSVSPAFYTASGAFSASDTESVVDTTATSCNMTLAAGTNGVRHGLHNASSLTCNFTLSSFDGIASYTFPVAPTGNMAVYYNTTRATYLFY